MKPIALLFNVKYPLNIRGMESTFVLVHAVSFQDAMNQLRIIFKMPTHGSDYVFTMSTILTKEQAEQLNQKPIIINEGTNGNTPGQQPDVSKV